MLDFDLSILEDREWWVPYHVPPTEGNVIVSGGMVLAASAPMSLPGSAEGDFFQLVLIFEERQDALDYLAEYRRKSGPAPDITGLVLSFEPTWDGFDAHALAPNKVADVLLGHGHVPLVVHHAWFDSIMKKLRNQGIPASTTHASLRHAQLARRMRGR